MNTTDWPSHNVPESFWNNQLGCIFIAAQFIIALVIYFRRLPHMFKLFRLRKSLSCPLANLKLFALLVLHHLVDNLELVRKTRKIRQTNQTPTVVLRNDQPEQTIQIQPFGTPSSVLFRDHFCLTVKLAVHCPITQKSVNVIACLDSSAELSMISFRLVDRLQTFATLVGPSVYKDRSKDKVYFRKVTLELHSLDQTSGYRTPCLSIPVDEFDSIPYCPSPSTALFNAVTERYDIRLSNDTNAEFDQEMAGQQVDLLLGRDLLASVYQPDQHNHFICPNLVVFRTRFGYTAHGVFDPNHVPQQIPAQWVQVQQPAIRITRVPLQAIEEDLKMALDKPILTGIYYLLSILLLILANIVLFMLRLITSMLTHGPITWYVTLVTMAADVCPTRIYNIIRHHQRSMERVWIRRNSGIIHELDRILARIKGYSLMLKNYWPWEKSDQSISNISFDFLPTIGVKVRRQSKQQILRFINIEYPLLATCTAFSFISQELAVELGCELHQLDMSFEVEGDRVEHFVVVQMQSLVGSDTIIEVPLYVRKNMAFRVVKKISGRVLRTINKHFGIELCCKPKLNDQKVHISIGADQATKLLLPNQQNLYLTTQLRLVPTTLGWSLQGSRNTGNPEFANFQRDTHFWLWIKTACVVVFISCVSFIIRT